MLLSFVSRFEKYVNIHVSTSMKVEQYLFLWQPYMSERHWSHELKVSSTFHTIMYLGSDDEQLMPPFYHVCI